MGKTYSIQSRRGKRKVDTLQQRDRERRNKYNRVRFILDMQKENGK